MHYDHAIGSVFVFKLMALFKYLTTPRKGLPNPQGSLAVSVPSRAIAQANAEVQQVLNDKKKQKKHGPYNQ